MGYPAAYFIARAKGNKAILLLLLMLPFWISYIIRTMSWINILGVSGAFNSALMAIGVISEPIQMLYNETTVILGLVHFLLPFMVLNVFVSLDGIDVTLEDAACSLGATRWQSFSRSRCRCRCRAWRPGGCSASCWRRAPTSRRWCWAGRPTPCSPIWCSRRSSRSSTGRSARRCR
jgi:ABC-type sulfate transport system permease component